MAEDEAMFDPTLKKKKKKKKTPFDLDAALAGEEPAEPTTETPAQNEPEETEEKKDEDFNIDDDFSNLTKKKKKKKKPFDFGELEETLPKSEETNGGVGGESAPSGDMALDDDLEMDLSLPSKKKKKKKIILEDEEPSALNEEDEADDLAKKTGHAWAGSDRDYTYDELLKRVFDIMREKNPDMIAGEKKKFNMKPPRVMRVGTKKTSFSNFKEICKMLHRQPEHLLLFLLAELGTSGSIDGNDQLIIKGRFQPKQIENVLRSYIKEYVTCHTCKSRDTMLQRDTRLYFLQCETCGSRCSVTTIKSGFQAVTGKRAAMRAKTT